MDDAKKFIQKLELDLDLSKGSNLSCRKERLTTTLKQYWDRVRKDNPFPNESLLDPSEVPDIWDSCFIVEANNKTKVDGYFYKHIGKLIKQAYKYELNDVQLDRIVNTQANHLAREYEKVLAIKIPLQYEGEIELSEDRVMKYRQILLPLGKDKINIESIVGGFSYKIFNK